MPLWKYPTVGNNSETRKPIDGGRFFAGIEIILVGDKTNSRDQVVFAHEKETVIVAKKNLGAEE